jgi:L-2-hydroxyglutarate oxidase LhgO
MPEFDFAVIGAGIVGCAVAKYISEITTKSVIVIEKERSIAYHTSSRNSGVLHSGFSQKPGTLKARFCVEGNKMVRDYCTARGLDIVVSGTTVVARNDYELKVLEELKRRGDANGVPELKILGKDEMREKEPNSIGIAALHSPSGAIVDPLQLTSSFAGDARRRGVSFAFGEKVLSLSESDRVRINTATKTYTCNYLINCAGLHADRIARYLNCGVYYRIVPFRGIYYRVRDEKKDYVKSMIYPAPNLNFPFLGIHLTRTVKGSLIVGPNASVAMGREAYRVGQVQLDDAAYSFLFPGTARAILRKEFVKLLLKEEISSISKKRFFSRVSLLVRGIDLQDLLPWSSGIRAQLLDARGNLVDDFLVEFSGRSVHILNAVSPGLTSSLPFAKYVVDKAIEQGIIQV